MNVNLYIGQKKSEFIHQRLGNFRKVDDITDEDIIKLLLMDETFKLEPGDILVDVKAMFDLTYGPSSLAFVKILKGKDLYYYQVNKGTHYNIDYEYKEWVQGIYDQFFIKLQPVICTFKNS